jgi:DNA (cytosine-5)-methyltransferase 3A
MGSNKKMNILSLFDGISCAKVALDKVGIDYDTYYSSEIDKHAITISDKNHKNIVRLGDVRGVGAIDNLLLLIGGSPCQDLSISKRGRKGLSGDRSSLFYEYLRILELNKPKYFILENVNSMPKEAKDEITKCLGVSPIMLDASLFSAQQRKRLFWTNIELSAFLPMDKGIVLKDILLPDTFSFKDKAYCLTATMDRSCLQDFIMKSNRNMVFNKPIKVCNIKNGGQGYRVYSIDGKSVNLSANGGGAGAKTGLYLLKEYARKLHPIECERLMGLPDDYTEGIANTNRYKVLGNAFHVDVVAYILKNIK